MKKKMTYDEFMNMNDNDFMSTNENERIMKRGQIYRVSQHSRKRYTMCLIIQNDKGNENSSRTIIAEVTIGAKKPLPVHVELHNTNFNHLEVLTQNIFTISKNDLGIFVGECSEEEMEKVDAALAISIGLNQPQPLKEITPAKTEEPFAESFVCDKQSKEAREYIASIYSSVKHLEESIQRLNNANQNFAAQIMEVEALSQLDQEQLDTIKQIALGSIEQTVANNRILLTTIMDFSYSNGPDGRVKDLNKAVEKIVEGSKSQEKRKEAQEQTIEPKAEEPIKPPKEELEKKHEFDPKGNRVLERGWRKGQEFLEENKEFIEKNRKTVAKSDVMEMVELKDAGWSDPQIAEKFGKTVNAVAVAICNQRKKMGEKVEAKPKKEEPIKEPKKPLDMGKVMALRKAGWTNPQIGEEFGRSAQNIAMMISRYKQTQKMVKEMSE